MPKLIKKYQAGNQFAIDKSSGYPNTVNVGASKAPKVDASNIPSSIGASAIPKVNLNSLGKIDIGTGGTGGNFLSGIGNFFSNTGKGVFNGLGGASGILNLGSSVVDSLLPERITSTGVDIANNVLGVAGNIPVVGKYAQVAKILMNTLDSVFGSNLAEVRKDQGVQDALAGEGGGYGNFMDKWDEASRLSGKRVGLFASKSALNDKIYEANRQMSILEGITGKKKTDDILTAQMGDRWNQATMNDLNGGFGNIAFGRLGLKVEILPKVHAILNAPKVVDTLTEWEEIPEFKKGGRMNVIPEGSLHARLHHMENAESLTKKGIPVVSIAEGGEMEQQAEIELNEIIFNLDVTTELEKLMKDDSDNAAIEAGKLLVKEIFENTDDRTGLIKQLEPEKKEPTTEDIVKNHQVFKEGGVLEKINDLSPEQIDKLINFLNEL